MIKADRTSVLHALNRFLSLNSVHLVALCAHGTEVVVVILGLSSAFEYMTKFPTSKAFVSPARTSLDVHHTGGEGSVTQWVHGEFIVISEAIRSHFTHQAHGKHF